MRGASAAAVVNQMERRKSCALHRWRETSRRGRKRSCKTGNRLGSNRSHRPERLGEFRRQRGRRQYKRHGHQRRPRRILAAGHGARRHGHAAHLVLAIHSRRMRNRSLLFEGPLYLLFVVMRWNLAVPARATIHSMSDQQRTRQWRIHQRDGQKAQPAENCARALLVSRAHSVDL